MTEGVGSEAQKFWFLQGGWRQSKGLGAVGCVSLNPKPYTLNPT